MLRSVSGAVPVAVRFTLPCLTPFASNIRAPVSCASEQRLTCPQTTLGLFPPMRPGLTTGAHHFFGGQASGRYEGGMTKPPPAVLAADAPDWANRAMAELVELDPLLATITERAGPLPWRRREAGFAGLLRSLCGQMISNQAATAIWGRLSALPGALNPAGLLALTDEELRQAGLSRPKLRHARALAEAFASNRLSADILAALPDGAAVAAIAEIPGFGPWTAEVHLLFGLDRRDIFPAGDLALAASLAALRGLPHRPKPKELAELAKAWRPWRSMAARLLWHNWRHVTGRPAGEAG
jgi:DNA-3-methyladenine glycosylase II